VKNPKRGFVSSANQSSTDPKYPYYINWEFAPAERGRRINTRLQTMNKATVDSLRELQNDNYNLKAEDWLPTMLSFVQKPSQKQMVMVRVLQLWNKFNNPDEI
jgi:penicillin amidase